MYADDTVLFIHGKDVNVIETQQSDDMSHLAKWLSNNELLINSKKVKLNVCYLVPPKG